MDNRVTLREVAQRAGVAISTASRALDPATQTMVLPETIERVLFAARALGYQPNSLARALKTNKSFAIGMLLPDLMNPFFPPIVRGIEDTLNHNGYNLLLGNTDDDLAREASQLESMLGRRVDGLILATAQMHDPTIEGLVDAGIHVVLVNRFTDNPGLSSVTCDDHLGVSLAIAHLVGLGHRQIAHIAGPRNTSTGLVRQESFKFWLGEAGIQQAPSLIEPAATFSVEHGAQAFAALISRTKDVTAVFAANDLIAIGCYQGAAEVGLQIGVDMSVVGYNDIPFASNLGPPLTTVRLPSYEMGVRAAEEVLAGINGTSNGPSRILLQPSMVVRKSTTPVSRRSVVSD